MQPFEALPFDRDDPPRDPPPGCVNRLLWQVSRRVFTDHRPGADGWCVTCRPFEYYPCVGRRLADAGLAAAHAQPHGTPWRLGNQRSRRAAS